MTLRCDCGRLRGIERQPLTGLVIERCRCGALAPISRREPPPIVRPCALKTHCKYGHAYTPANTYYHRDGTGRRSCRQCRAARMKIFHTFNKRASAAIAD